MKIRAGMPFVRRDAAEKVECDPGRNGVLTTESFSFANGPLCILAMGTRQSARQFGTSQSSSFLKQARFIHFLRGTINAVHTSPGEIGIHQQQGGIAFVLAHFDRAVRGDGSLVRIIRIRNL